MWKYVLIIAVLFSLFGCDLRTTDPEDRLWSWVHVYENGEIIYDDVLDVADDSTFVTLYLLDESQVNLSKYVNIYYPLDPTQGEDEIDRDYIILAEKEDYFTRFYQCGYQDTIIIDVVNGFSPIIPSIICGTLFTSNHYPVANNFFNVLQDSVIVYNITTNGFGYFSNDSLGFGNYLIIEEEFFEEGLYSDFIVTNFYDDYYISIFTFDYKPNIYLYPTERININVSLSFPNGGKVTTSIPDYGSGWNDMDIDPSGKINDEYSYLFYESVHPDLYQYKCGWLVKREELETFIIKNLAETGFVGQEIIDFTDYWIPLLIDYPYYAIYPQYNKQLSGMTELEFSIEPDNLLRLLYAIEGLQNDDLVLHEPEIPKFKREGFVVVEWGVIRKFENQDIITINDNGK